MEFVKKNRVSIEKLLKSLIIIVLLFRAIQQIYITFSTATALPLGSRDFQWDVAKLLTQKVNIYTMDWFNTPTKIQPFEPYYDEINANQFPSTLWFLLPWTFFDAVTAKAAWYVCTRIIFYVCLFI